MESVQQRRLHRERDGRRSSAPQAVHATSADPAQAPPVPPHKGPIHQDTARAPTRAPARTAAFRPTSLPTVKPSAPQLRSQAPPSEAREQWPYQQAQLVCISNAPISSSALLNPMANRGPRSPARDSRQASRLTTGF
ncbi:hypothetical protein NDU88_001185 [Pleurodeles waltl]|uniref:Uncharacterized protein n=1 Tax=Pleurodeles waltl TaxID=8319 RepID=A0AAV7L8S1_PLEWA|nr:hypothetical protein NDU88_001185 [Pleurodeles waltl]